MRREDIITTAVSRDNYERTPLARACEKGHADVAHQLLSVSDPVALDKEHRTPLSLAAGAGKATLVELLLADIRVAAQADEPDQAEQTPLCWAASEGHESVVAVLISSSAGKLIQVDIDSPVCAGQTPLSIAAQNGHLSVMRQLLAAGASPSSQDTDNKTPLWWAASEGKTDVVRFLLQKGVDPNTADEKDKQTPLMVAAKKGHSSAVSELTRSGAVQLGAKNKYGKTALWFAARAGHKDVIKALLDGVLRFPEDDMQDAAAAAHDAGRTDVEKLIKEMGERHIAQERPPTLDRRRSSAPESVSRGFDDGPSLQKVPIGDKKKPGIWRRVFMGVYGKIMDSVRRIAGRRLSLSQPGQGRHDKTHGCSEFGNALTDSSTASGFH
jgi:ankyrin repeat protein